jgi:XisH protein
MPTQDLYHDVVRDALRKDGWRITHTALQLNARAEASAGEPWEGPWLIADKDERKVAVAVSSFVGRSNLADILQTWRQLALSRSRLHAMDSDRVVYLAVRQATYSACFGGTEGNLLLEKEHMQLLVFDPRAEVIVQWVPRF